ncbi:MAG: EAL domain-containing protein [Halospina sp.]
MAQKTETIHLLLLDPSQNDAEQVVSLLRNAGRATRAHRVTSPEDLQEALGSGTWDLMLIRDAEQEPSPEEALDQIRRQDRDLPTILMTASEDGERRSAIMERGAQDAVSFDNSTLLRQVIDRELANLGERRQRRSLSGHLRDAEQRCHLLLESSKDAIAYINDGLHVYANQSYLELLGYEDPDDLLALPVLDTLDSGSQQHFKEAMKQFREGEEPQEPLTVTIERPDGETIEVTAELSAATYDGEPCIQIVARPVQDSAELAEKLQEISSKDVLTGLYNRHHLMDTLSQTIARVQKDGSDAALAYIALDEFVHKKTQIGISGADLVIGDMAGLIAACAREDQVVARLSDDAFCILGPQDTVESMKEVAETLRKRVEDHLFDVSGRTLQLTVSIGIAAITENAPQAEDLVGRAHTAADEVRQQEGHEAGNGINVHEPQLQSHGSADGTADAIQQALDNDQFRLLFQPIINLRGEGEEHYEAFVRMLDEHGKEVSPYDFLPPGGPVNTAAKIDRWVVLQTIKQLASHRSKGHETRLFLNVTAETVQDQTFPSWLGVALKAARLPGDSLVFQIAERDATTYLKQARDFCNALRELHCSLSITHFGGALNPFNTLKHLDVDYVKLDGSYTDEIQKNEESRQTVKEMIQSLHQQGRLTVMPLVESASVLATIWQAGVNYIQGYYLQAPTPDMNYDFGEGD